MDRSLQALCVAIKKIVWQLKPQHNALSFTLLTGKPNQGKTTLLRQAHFEHVAVDTERAIDIYFNQEGIIVELGESWINQSKHVLQYTIRQLNRCHSTLKITGIVLCVDINEFLKSEPLQFAENSKLHTQLLARFGSSLNYQIDATIIFTKLDAVAGFCDFFQNLHTTELQKPLGFSLDWGTKQGKLVSNFRSKFEQFIEVLGQQVISKMHPARSSIKRTLIREFPLQLSTLGPAIQTFLQGIPTTPFRVHAIYFTSGEQGGVSIDRLNKKIQHEYALTIQDTFPQSINHRAYFIEGALNYFQEQTKRHPPTAINKQQKWIALLLASTTCLALIYMGSQYVRSSNLLDDVSKELLTYDALIKGNHDEATSLYHLARASNDLQHLTANPFFLPSMRQLKTKLNFHTKQQLKGNFLPIILSEMEQTIIDTRQSQAARYDALKIYLMLGDVSKYSQPAVLSWFKTHWKHTTPNENIDRKLSLLKQAIRQPMQPVAINRQMVSDIRNYLNALPVSYLYYTLAKAHFPQDVTPLSIDGFLLTEKELPVYFTKAGFKEITQMIPSIAAELQKDNWVLARQDLTDLETLIKQAYCYEYVVWWQNFMRKSAPIHFQDYQQAHRLTLALHQSNAITKLVDLIQKETSPELGDKSSLFNQEIASKFTELSLMSQTTIHDITRHLNELEKFLTTLSVVSDQGRTAFNLVKSRFEGDTISNPLSALYANVSQLPEPVSNWAKQVGDDTWYILINDARRFINEMWQQTVFREYQYSIAKRYPFDASQSTEVSIADFERFFSGHGVLNNFTEQYLKPFLDTSQPQWQLKELNNYVLPISADMVNELIRANVISNMFFPEKSNDCRIDFSLQKISLDPIVSSLQLVIGDSKLHDTQDSDKLIQFHWPESNARLTLNSIEGQHYELEEHGPWAFFKMLQNFSRINFFRKAAKRQNKQRRKQF